MTSRIENMAATVGRAIGSLQKGIADSRGMSQVRDTARRTRAAFLGAWAESSRWLGGDFTRKDAQQRALQTSWFFTAIHIIAYEICTATLRVVEQTDADADPVQIKNHPFERILRRPNEHMGRAFLWIYTALWLLLDGNAYWYIAVDEDGDVAELWPLPSKDTSPWPGTRESGKFIDYFIYVVNGMEYHIPPDYIVHFMLPNPFDIFRGMSKLLAAMLPIDADRAMAYWNGRFFDKDNVMPSAIINLSSGDPNVEVDPEDVERLKSDLKSEYSAVARKTAITTADSVQAVLLGWNPREMDFIQGRQYTKEEIFQIVGVHPGAVDKNATEANAVVADRFIKEKTVWPILVLMAEQITAQLITRFYSRDCEAAFDDVRPANRSLELQEIEAARPYLSINDIRKRYFKAPPVAWGTLPAEHGSNAMLDPSSGGGSANMPGQVMRGIPSLATHGLDPAQLGVESPKALLTAPSYVDDLKRWREKAIRSFKRVGTAAVEFESATIPGAVLDTIQEALQIADTLDEIKAAFVLPSASPTKAVTTDETRPWDSYELRFYRLLRRILGEEAQRIARAIEREGDGALDKETLWQNHEANILDALTNNLASLALFGAQAAQESLGEPSLAVNWHLVNQQAADYAREYAAEMVSNITDTTRQRLREEHAAWIESGEPMDGLIRRIEGLTKDDGAAIFNRARARLIAQTESTNIYANANAMAWQASGIPPAMFKPTAHIGCRCYLQPYKLPNGEWVIVWYTARDDLVCVEPIETPWGKVEGCRGLHTRIVSQGKWLGRKLSEVKRELKA